MFKPFNYLYDHHIKYKSKDSIYHLVVFGDKMYLSGYKTAYLKFRSWTRN